MNDRQIANWYEICFGLKTRSHWSGLKTDGMKWLEIVEVRAAQIDDKLMIQQVACLLGETQMNDSVKIYINVRSGTDWSFHLQHESEQIDLQGSDLAMQFKRILRKFGIVNHSIWEEHQNGMNTKLNK